MNTFDDVANPTIKYEANFIKMSRVDVINNLAIIDKYHKNLAKTTSGHRSICSRHSIQHVVH